MKYVSNRNRKACLLIGFAFMLLCGISDCLLSFMGEGEPYAIEGLVSMNISEVPLWYYQVSFVIGIFAAAGYYLGTSSVWSHIQDRPDGTFSKLAKCYALGATMMSVGIFGIHTICCLALMNVRAAVLSGVSAESIGQYFISSSLYPFIVGTIWQTAADLVVGISFILLVWKRQINVSKAWILVGPLSLYVICQVLGSVLSTVSGNTSFAHWLAGGESWGIAFMFLAVFMVQRQEA